MSAGSKVVQRAAGMVTILRALPGQTRVPFLPREALEDLRDRRVRDTVSYAAEHVPFYRDIFRDEGIDPGEIQTADDLTRLPLVGRDEVLPEAREFRSVAPSARDGIELESSGTTGVPLRLLHDRRSVLRNVAYAERERAVQSALVDPREIRRADDLRRLPLISREDDAREARDGVTLRSSGTAGVSLRLFHDRRSVELSLLEDADFEPVAEQAVAAVRSPLRGCEIRPVHRQDIALATGGKHRLVVPLRSAE